MRGRRLLQILAATLAAAAAAAVCVPVAQNVTVMAFGARPPAEVSAYDVSVKPDGCTVVAQLTVGNTTSRTETGSAWWDLSAPSQQPPWRHPRFQSTAHVFTLSGGANATLRWQEPARVATGSYEATYWVHVLPPGGHAMSHSDGGTMGSLLIAPARAGCHGSSLP